VLETVAIHLKMQWHELKDQMNKTAHWSKDCQLSI